MSNVLRTYFRMLLDKKSSQICLGTCAVERKVKLSLHAHVLGDFLIFVQYQTPCVSNSHWFTLELAFCFCFHFSPTVLVC